MRVSYFILVASFLVGCYNSPLRNKIYSYSYQLNETNVDVVWFFNDTTLLKIDFCDWEGGCYFNYLRDEDGKLKLQETISYLNKGDLKYLIKGEIDDMGVSKHNYQINDGLIYTSFDTLIFDPEKNKLVSSAKKKFNIVYRFEGKNRSKVNKFINKLKKE